MKIYTAFIMIMITLLGTLFDVYGVYNSKQYEDIIKNSCESKIIKSSTKSGNKYYLQGLSCSGVHPVSCKKTEIYPNSEKAYVLCENNKSSLSEKDKQTGCYGYILKDNNLHHLKYDDTTQECTSAKVYDHETGYISPQTYETHHLSRWRELKYYFKYLWGKWF